MGKTTRKDDEKKDAMGCVELPIEWHASDRLESRYATHLVVQHDGRDFFLSFYEIVPPLLLGEDVEARVKEMKSVRANCVSRIIVPKERMLAFVDTLNKNVTKLMDVVSTLDKKSEGQ